MVENFSTAKPGHFSLCSFFFQFIKHSFCYGNIHHNNFFVEKYHISDMLCKIRAKYSVAKNISVQGSLWKCVPIPLGNKAKTGISVS